MELKRGDDSPSNPVGTSTRLNTTLLVLIITYFAGCVINIAVHANDLNVFQWDFYTYYNSASAIRSGINPYDPGMLLFTGGQMHPYVYPPLTLLAFVPFSALSYPTAYLCYLALKCAAIIGLVVLWQRKFLHAASDPLFYALFLLAFNGAMYLELQAGNLSLFEQVGLWLAFWMFATGRTLLFCVLIVVTASFKLQPIVFLGLLLIRRPDLRRWFSVIASAAAFGGLLYLQYLLRPGLFRGFLATAALVSDERGIVNPSTYALAQDLGAWLYGILGTPDAAAPSGLGSWIYAAIAIVVLGFSLDAFRRQRRDTSPGTSFSMVCLACCLYGLLSLRFKDYSYILMIVPLYHAIRLCDFVDKKIVLALLAALSAAHITLPGLVTAAGFWWNYYPLAITFGVWSVLIRKSRSGQPNAQIA